MTDTVLAPWDFGDASGRSYQAQINQQRAEDRVREAYREFAEAEERYRTALATKILELKADGMAITACSEVARGHTTVAKLRRDRDIAEGLKEAAQAAVWRHTANRKDVLHFAEWSMRRELAEGAL